jgi:hypothetical protein
MIRILVDAMHVLIAFVSLVKFYRILMTQYISKGHFCIITLILLCK